MMTSPVRVLGLVGSLRAKSFNRAALAAAQELLPAGMSLESFDLAPLPMFNQDLEANLPAIVVQFKEAIAAADAVLMVTPEFNYSVPALLKNAIDWASRPPLRPLDGKPVAIMGASGGPLGTARAQYHLRQILLCTNALVLNKPEVFIMKATEKFDAAGRLTDEPTRQAIAALLAGLEAWTRRLRGH